VSIPSAHSRLIPMLLGTVEIVCFSLTCGTCCATHACECHGRIQVCARPSLNHAVTCRRGDFIASGGAGGELRVWDLASREMVVHLKHHSLAITDLKVGVLHTGSEETSPLVPSLKRMAASTHSCLQKR
jgi:hypothetical protein